MRIIFFFLITFCVYACKENVREKEAGVEWDKLGLDKMGLKYDPDNEVHLGGGLCVVKYPPTWQDQEWLIVIYNCYDLLPADTVAPTENVLKYKQGGLCFYHDCSIEPKKSFTVFMNIPIGFIESRAYRVFASRHSDSAMLYKYTNNPKYHSFQDSISINKILKNLESGKTAKKAKPEQVHKEEHMRAHNRKLPLVFFKEYDKFWEELFLEAEPLKKSNYLKELFSETKLLKTKSTDLKEQFRLSDKCNLEFCSTKDILNPLYDIGCRYGLDSKRFDCESFDRKLEPRCLRTLGHISREYDILMHNGAFPAGDCDLGNWRYIKIDSLSVEHSKKLKELLSLDDIQTDAKMQNSSNLEKQ
jgi:hypothetical protein